MLDDFEEQLQQMMHVMQLEDVGAVEKNDFVVAAVKMIGTVVDAAGHD